jgi:hypothetical protein
MKQRILPRKPVILSESTERCLGTYALAASAAGVTALALAVPAADAKIIYTKTHVQLQNNQPLALDFNQDGKTDFFLLFKGPNETVGGEFYEYLVACHRPVAATHGYECISSVSSTYNPLNAIRVNKTGSAIALLAGKGIQKGERFKDKVVVGMGGVNWETFSTGRTEWGGPWVNGGKGVKNRYLGVKFQINGHSHFAWARLTVTTTPPHDFKATLTGYAYETIPGKAIIAGQTKGSDDADNSVGQPNPTSQTRPTPEPATLGALAMGAPGLSIWRREPVGALP